MRKATAVCGRKQQRPELPRQFHYTIDTLHPDVVCGQIESADAAEETGISHHYRSASPPRFQTIQATAAKASNASGAMSQVMFKSA